MVNTPNENDKTFGAKRGAPAIAGGPVVRRLRPDPERWQRFLDNIRPAMNTAWVNCGEGDIFFRWRTQQYDLHKLHPVVLAALAACQPNALRQILFQWPHVAEDATKLAYTPTPGYLLRDRVITTTPGKYLRAMFALLPDNGIRDLTATHIDSPERFGIAVTMDQMLEVMEKGPTSCMAGTARGFDSFPHHPYEVYDPALGWGLAFERDTRVAHEGRFRSRCLVHRHENTFVRSFYAGEGYNGYSHASPAIEQWLKGQGYTQEHGWDGQYIALLHSPKGRVCPFIDGDAQRVSETSKERLRISEHEGHVANNTNGLLAEDEDEDSTNCDACDERVPIDDTSGVGLHGEGTVCSSCLSRDYTYAYGRRREQYYVPDNEAMRGNDGESYHVEYASDNDRLVLDDGQCVAEEDVTRCLHDDGMYVTDDKEWFEVPDGQVVEHNIEHYLRQNIDLLPTWDGAINHHKLMRQFIEAVRDGEMQNLDDKDVEALLLYCEVTGETNPLPQARIDKETIPLALGERETPEETTKEST